MVHDMIAEKFQGISSNKWNNLEIEMKRLVLHKSDHIIAISKNTKKDLLDIYPAILPEKVTVIYNGITQKSEVILPPFDSLIQKFQLDLQPRHYFLYVGQRNSYKNFKIIVELLQNFPEYQDYRILCIGGENPGDESTSLISTSLQHCFIFLDYICDDDLSVFYQNALALIYPSLYEGFGLPITEAMSNNCPVICSKTSSLPEVGGNAAYYFDPNSIDSLDIALTQMLSTSREEIIESGLRNIKRFSWDQSTLSLVNLYRSLVKENS
jgi:glycosyltransferase involved in cell wall biosynthesis